MGKGDGDSDSVLTEMGSTQRKQAGGQKYVRIETPARHTETPVDIRKQKNWRVKATAGQKYGNHLDMMAEARDWTDQ